MIMTTLRINNLSRPVQPVNATLADTFFSKFLGLMFQKSITPDTGLLLSDSSESRINSSIHMLCMNFDICAVWINQKNQVVDVQLAKKWHLAYFPKSAARHVLELHASRMNDFSINDQLQMDYEK